VGSTSPRKLKLTRFLRIFLPIFVSLLIGFGPLAVQTIVSYTQSQAMPTATGSVMDVSDDGTFNHQQRFLKGDVEFFYNRWIVSEPSNADTSVSFETPGLWTSREYEGLGRLTRDGYASYRYTIRGLIPGVTLCAFANIEVPNRIYLNGHLCSETGTPSKTLQSSFVELNHESAGTIVVPANGEVVYVMEVGNTGDGGAEHILSVYVQGTIPLDNTNRIFAPIALGFVAASVVALTLLVVTSRLRSRALLLAGGATSVGLFYLFSKDSLLVGLSISYSAPVFGSLLIAAFALLMVLLLVIGVFRPGTSMSVNEALVLIIGIGISALAYPFLHGTGYAWVSMAMLATFPLYMFIRSIVMAIRGQSDGSYMVLFSPVLGMSLVMLVFSTNFYQRTLMYHPTFFAVVMTLLLVATGFNDTYLLGLERKDKAVLERRYRNISNRALARLASENETIATLSMIGESYERSLKAGDRKLLGFSTLMRRRLLALREDAIPFEEECELESQLLDLHNSINENPVTLLLDTEEGTMSIPPLLFEAAITEAGQQIDVDDYLTLWEGKRSVGMSFPKNVEISLETKRSIRERCLLAGLSARFESGRITISEGKKR